MGSFFEYSKSLSMLKNLIVIFGCFLYSTGSAQIAGHVWNESNEPLAYATVYVNGSNVGASTNTEGYYSINPQAQGSIEVICQYLGYKTKTEIIQYAGKPLTLDFRLEEETILAPTVEVNADAEDPAYAVIRQAIKKRKFHQNKIKSYSCESYIKGRFDLEKVPKMMLSVMIDGNNFFDVDSNGQGHRLFIGIRIFIS